MVESLIDILLAVSFEEVLQGGEELLLVLLEYDDVGECPHGFDR